MLRHAPPDVSVDRAQPLAVATYWQQFGAQMFLALAVALVIASIGYVAVVRSSNQSPSTSLGVVRYLTMTAALSALSCAAALLFPVVFSSDVYAYAGYGDMALHGISPYAHARIAMPDPLLDAVVWQWGNPPPMCVYGPAFVWLAQAIVAALLPLGAAAPLWAFRIVACIALVACAPLAYAAFARFPQSTRLAAAGGIALNPVAIWSAAEGHNDTIALAVVLGGFALAMRSRVFAGALVVALSALVKAPGAIAALALAIASWPQRSVFVRAAGGAALGIALVAGLAIPLEYGVRAHLAPQGHYFPQYSVQYVSVWLGVGMVVVLVLASTCSAVLRYLRMTRAPALLALAAWVAIPNPYPWYGVWLLPVAFLVWPGRAAWALIAASLLIALRYYAEATTALSHPLGIAMVAVMFGVPLLLAFTDAHTAIARRGRPENHTPAPDFATYRSR
jgi:hypothetical protein